MPRSHTLTVRKRGNSGISKRDRKAFARFVRAGFSSADFKQAKKLQKKPCPHVYRAYIMTQLPSLGEAESDASTLEPIALESPSPSSANISQGSSEVEEKDDESDELFDSVDDVASSEAIEEQDADLDRLFDYIDDLQSVKHQALAEDNPPPPAAVPISVSSSSFETDFKTLVNTASDHYHVYAAAVHIDTQSRKLVQSNWSGFSHCHMFASKCIRLYCSDIMNQKMVCLLCAIAARRDFTKSLRQGKNTSTGTKPFLFPHLPDSGVSAVCRNFMILDVSGLTENHLDRAIVKLSQQSKLQHWPTGKTFDYGKGYIGLVAVKFSTAGVPTYVNAHDVFDSSFQSTHFTILDPHQAKPSCGYEQCGGALEFFRQRGETGIKKLMKDDRRYEDFPLKFRLAAEQFTLYA